MSTSTGTGTPAPTGHLTAGQRFDLILHDIIAFGLVAASIFVKNPNSQQHAATIIQAITPLIPMVDAQLTGEVPLSPTPAVPTQAPQASPSVAAPVSSGV